MSNLHLPPAQFLAETFEFEYCPDCGGAVCHHTALPVLGNWFARCDYPADDTLPHVPVHPAVKEYHRLAGTGITALS